MPWSWVTERVRYEYRTRPVSDSGGSVPDVTGRVRYRYRTHPVFWPGAGRVVEVTELWLSGVTGR